MTPPRRARGQGDREPDDGAWDRPPADGGGYGGEPEYGWGPPGYPPPGHSAGGYAPAGSRADEPSWLPDPPPARPVGRASGYPGTPRRAARRRRRPPWVALAIAAAAVVAVLVLGFVAPGWFVTRVFDAAAVQNGVTRVLTDDYGVDGVADVRCPAAVEVAAGATFTCDATIDGDPVTVPVRVTDGDGGYEVGRPS